MQIDSLYESISNPIHGVKFASHHAITAGMATLHDREFFNRKARQESGFPADRDIRRQMGRDELTWPNAVRVDEREWTPRPQAPTAK